MAVGDAGEKVIVLIIHLYISKLLARAGSFLFDRFKRRGVRYCQINKQNK